MGDSTRYRAYIREYIIYSATLLRERPYGGAGGSMAGENAVFRTTCSAGLQARYVSTNVPRVEKLELLIHAASNLISQSFRT